jgi:hypothetical protein
MASAPKQCRGQPPYVLACIDLAAGRRFAFGGIMTINSLSSTAEIVQSAISSALNKTSQLNSTAASQDDTSQVSDFGSLMKQLDELQKSDPAKYKEVASEVSSQLEEAAKSAAEDGDSQSAEMLNDLASKFKTASETGEKVDMHPHGRPPMGPPPASSDSDSDTTSSTGSSTDSSSGSSTSSTTDDDSGLASLLQAYQSNWSTDPMDTLAGILKNALASQSA